jgi:hypothetical protein
LLLRPFGRSALLLFVLLGQGLHGHKSVMHRRVNTFELRTSGQDDA